MPFSSRKRKNTNTGGAPGPKRFRQTLLNFGGSPPVSQPKPDEVVSFSRKNGAILFSKSYLKAYGFENWTTDEKWKYQTFLFRLLANNGIIIKTAFDLYKFTRDERWSPKFLEKWFAAYESDGFHVKYKNPQSPFVWAYFKDGVKYGRWYMSHPETLPVKPFNATDEKEIYV